MTSIRFLLLMVLTISAFMPPIPICYSYGCAQKGDTMSTVLNNCGEPTWVDRREERRWGAVPYGTVIDGWYISERSTVGQVIVEIEEWTYDLGRTKFMRIFMFENGILINIGTGGYGH